MLNKIYVDVIYLKATIFRVNTQEKSFFSDVHTLLVIPGTKLFTSNNFELLFHFNRNQWRKIKNTISANTGG